MRGATSLAVAIVALTAPSTAPARPPLSNEARTAAVLDRIADSPPRLRLFLQAMPKGADLHNHGGGAIYAEDFLRWAAADGLCIATDTLRIVDPPCTAPNRIPAAGLEQDYARYSAMIDSLSTRGFEAGVGDPHVSGYDRFFSTFERFSSASTDNGGKMLAATRAQAAADRIAYVELGTVSREGIALAASLGTRDTGDFAALLAQVAPRLPAAIAKTRAWPMTAMRRRQRRSARAPAPPRSPPVR